jgi:WD40 repeat protein
MMTELGPAVFSYDGTLLATAALDVSADRNIRIWDTKTGAERDHFGITDAAPSLAFSPDGTMLAAGSANGQDRLFDLRGGAGAGKSLGLFGQGDGEVTAVAFSSDSKMLGASGRARVDLFHAPDMKPAGSVTSDRGNVYAVAFSPGEKFVAFSDNLSKIHIRAVGAAQPGPVAERNTMSRRPPSARRRTDERVSARSATGNIVSFEELDDPRTAQPYVAVAFSPDGTTIAAANENRTMCLIDPQARQRRFLLEGQPGTPSSIAFSPDGKLLASAASSAPAGGAGMIEPGHSVRVWDVASGKDLGYFVTQDHTFPGVCFTPDGKSILAPDEQGVLRAFDPQTRRPREGLSVKSDGAIGAVACSPDGKTIAMGLGMQPGGAVRVIDAASGRELARADLSTPCRSVAFSRDGKFLAAVGGNVRVFDTSSWREVASPKHRYYAHCAAFSPDGKTLATAAGEVKLWSVGTWKEIGEYRPSESDDFPSLAWSPDGKSIAIAAARAVLLWTPPPR